ncbi:hypothetical protein BDU57DRAFT_201795 [Ampelomyces quisqualis]|uniref:Uncharacterized protein n=1 Tax=Ampelomyces quisqualis TaxID=50730 RepID=A0A6A5QUM4_AMPQU|nr:hypothetical protein BDU57DRAFT_201795 [Ampelomyces quisqualis]
MGAQHPPKKPALHTHIPVHPTHKHVLMVFLPPKTNPNDMHTIFHSTFFFFSAQPFSNAHMSCATLHLATQTYLTPRHHPPQTRHSVNNTTPYSPPFPRNLPPAIEKKTQIRE